MRDMRRGHAEKQAGGGDDAVIGSQDCCAEPPYTFDAM